MNSSTIYWTLGIGILLIILFSYNACSHRNSYGRYGRSYHRSSYSTYGSYHNRRHRRYSSPIRNSGSSFRGRSYGGGGK